VGIDVESEAFWASALGTIKENIAKFEELLGN
jgi:oligoendopeptidase F